MDFSNKITKCFKMKLLKELQILIVSRYLDVQDVENLIQFVGLKLISTFEFNLHILHNVYREMVKQKLDKHLQESTCTIKIKMSQYKSQEDHFDSGKTIIFKCVNDNSKLVELTKPFFHHMHVNQNSIALILRRGH